MFWRQLRSRFRSWIYVDNRLYRSLNLCQARELVHKRRLSSKIYLQVIGSPSKDTAPSVLLFTDSERYLFNCGENFAKLAKNLDLPSCHNKIFLTGRQWKHIGGLPQLYFLPQTLSPPGIQIFGPAGISDIMESTDTFTKRPDVPEALIKCTEYANHHDRYPYIDNNVKIKPVSYPSHVDETECSICYICEMTDKRGSFMANKADALSIPIGSWRNNLHCGNVVTLPDGRTIYPHQVVTPSIPGSLFAVIECLSNTTMDALLSCDNFAHHFHSNDKKQFEVMVHITSKSIFENKKYQEWMAKFGSQTTHIVLHENTRACLSPFNIKSILDARLFGTDPVLFPVAWGKWKSPINQELPTNCHEGQIGLKYNFLPHKKKGICYYRVYKPNFKEKTNAYFTERVRAHLNFFHLTNEQKIDYYNTRVTFLGTCASKRTKRGGTSSILVELSSKCCFMLDCGDGTNYQLQRHYGDDTDRILSSLSFVFISHSHVDHYMGLVNVILNHMNLKEQGKVTKDFVIIGPETVYHWLQQLSSLLMVDLNYRYYTFSDFRSGNQKPEIRNLLSSMKLNNLSLVPVYHCEDSFGITISHNSGWKLVYSGDCVPSQKLWEEGIDATLLIHEATFLSDYQKADNVKHSTVEEAMAVAKKMRARYTILTHFSNRYSLSDLLATPLADGVNLAFDHMSVRLLDLPNLKKRQDKIRRILLPEKSICTDSQNDINRFYPNY
ncbi:zinc phosphodiesterase ELAC protein 2 [Exaiptasia diaphana]|uniref:ribonuclease Z n=1 Tax=Exaiptasia diaphana TaxID=2652724 RepID=A0A913X7A0_EXADI|nr:zinc phosphodiesterase ELAC protein 2 [Exaiptasia diaphana]KXJ28530.1 Zinc phosphodiesterase ELAC protein 2 [Exaiptasia diaphana]